MAYDPFADPFASQAFADPFANPEEEERSLIRELAAKGMSGLQYVGETLDKPGQALRGLLAGKPAELLNLIPFSDALGITSSEGVLGKYGMNLTDDEDAVSGRDLLEKMGALQENQDGLDWGDVAGFGVDILTDPTTWIPGVGFTKLGKAFKKAGLLPDAATQARRAGLDVAGAATARGKLTPRILLEQAVESGHPNPKAAVELALSKGKPGGKLIPDVTDNYVYSKADEVLDHPPLTPNMQRMVDAGELTVKPKPTWVDANKYLDPADLDKPIGGLVNVGVPFVDSAQMTLELPGLSNFLDKAYGNIRFGSRPMRALNTILDRSHSTGHGGDSRYAQEFAVPNARLHEQQELNKYNPLIAQYKGIAATKANEIANAYPDSQVDEALFSAAEGTGPDVAGVFDLNKKLANLMMDARHRGALPEGPLEDALPYAAHRNLQEQIGGSAGQAASADLKSGRQWPFRGASAEEQKAFFRSLGDKIGEATEISADLTPDGKVKALAELLRGDIQFRNPTGMSDEAYKAQRKLNQSVLPEVTGIDAPVHDIPLEEFISGRPSEPVEFFQELAAGIKPTGHHGIRKEAVDLSKIPNVYGPDATGYAIVARDKSGKPLSLAVFANTEGGGGGLVGVAKDFEQGAKGSLASMKVFKKMLAEGLEIPIDSMPSDAAALLHHVYVDDAARRGVELLPEVKTAYPNAGKSKALEGFLRTIKPSKKAELEEVVKKGSNLDRYEALARYGLAQSPEMLQAGVKMDPAGAYQVVGNATAEQAARSFTFQDALKDKDLFKKYGLTPDPTAGVTTTTIVPRELKVGSKVTFGESGTAGKVVDLDGNTALVKFLNPETGVRDIVPLDVAELSTKTKKVKTTTPMQEGVMKATVAAKQLGLDPQAFEFAPNVPTKFVEELMPHTPDPKLTGVMGWLGQAARDITAENKAAMTGAIFNPSFPARNRGSGGFANVYHGNTGLMGFLKGLGGALIPGFKTEAQRVGRGEALKGLAKEPAIVAKAAELGRTLVDDEDATNFAREIFASLGGSHGGKHTPDNLDQMMRGVGDFVGGMEGPKGPEAYSHGRVWNEVKKIWEQLRGREGGKQELFFGAPGSSFLNKGVVRQDPTSAFVKSGAVLNEFVENQNRFGPFLEMWKKGIDPVEGMRRVDRAQVSYDPKNYTDIEKKYLTTLFPFYKFLKGSTVGHAMELAERPGGGLSHLLQAGGQLHNPEEVLPEYVKENITIPVNKIPGLSTIFGTDDPESTRYLTQLGLGFEQPLQFVHGGNRDELPFKNALWELLGAANPALVKFPMEAMTGHSTFQQDETGFGKPTKGMDPSVGRLYSNIVEWLGGEKPRDPRIPYVPESLLANSPLTRPITSLKNLTDTRERGILKGLLGFLSGVKMHDVGEREQAGVKTGLAKELIRNIAGSREMTDFYIPKRILPMLSEEELSDRDKALLIKRIERRLAKQQAEENQSLMPSF